MAQDLLKPYAIMIFYIVLFYEKETESLKYLTLWVYVYI